MGRDISGASPFASRVSLTDLSRSPGDVSADSSEEEHSKKCCPQAATWVHKAWKRAEKPVTYSLYFLNVVYTLMVSALFAGFAARRAKGDSGLAAWYAVSSFFMNAPMAWFFSERVVKTVQRIQKKKERSFILFAFLGLVLSVGTTAAGVQIARESVEGLEFLAEQKWVHPPLIGFSIFNTFSTRLIGAIYLLYSVFTASLNTFQSAQARYAPYYHLLNDMENYGDEIQRIHPLSLESRHKVWHEKAGNVWVSENELDTLLRYVKTFYPSMLEQGLRPGDTWWHTAVKALVSMGTMAIQLFLMLPMIPLWIRLTEKGADAVSLELGSSKGFVFYASVSNVLFYVNAASKFIPLVLTFLQRVFDYLKAKGKEVGPEVSFIISSVIAVVGMGLWVTMPYYSGGGYGADALQVTSIQNETTNITTKGVNNFGDMANEICFDGSGLFKLIGAWTSWFVENYSYPTIIQVAAGVVVNGLYFTRACIDRLPCLQSPPVKEGTVSAEKMAKVLREALEKGRFDALEGAGQQGSVRDAIEQGREAANPRFSLWDDWCCGTRKVDDPVELSSQSSYAV